MTIISLTTKKPLSHSRHPFFVLYAVGHDVSRAATLLWRLRSCDHPQGGVPLPLPLRTGLVGGWANICVNGCVPGCVTECVNGYVNSGW